jgi:hypothetical protein
VPLLDGELDAGQGPPLVGVLIDPDRPYGAGEIARACGLSILGQLPGDRRTARVWSNGHPPGGLFGRSPLQRAAAALATRIRDAAAPDSDTDSPLARPVGRGHPSAGGRRPAELLRGPA